MTIMPELNNRELTHTDAHISTEKEEKPRENTLKESGEAEAEREVNQGEKEEKRESLPEESLRMMSWVEVENERQSAEENSEVEGVEEVGDGVEEQVLLEVEGMSMGEAEKEQTRSVEEELAMMEEKWREQCAINETLKQRLANEEERFRVRHALVNQSILKLSILIKHISAISRMIISLTCCFMHREIQSFQLTLDDYTSIIMILVIMFGLPSDKTKSYFVLYSPLTSL